LVCPQNPTEEITTKYPVVCRDRFWNIKRDWGYIYSWKE